MATNKELEQQVNGLRAMLEQLGLQMPKMQDAADPTKRPDYMDHEGPEYAAFLGLVALGSAEEAAERVIYTSPKTGRMYCLEDEIAAMRLVPGVDPEKAALAVLRQKVNQFESGKPQVPESAPAMWTPTPNPLAGIR